jgi:hypothetical protein
METKSRASAKLPDGLSGASSIASAILSVRGERVILDEDLARFYGVTTKRLNEQVKRNASRFPPDFMLQLTAGEYRALRSQSATLDRGRGRHRKYLPYAFTEHGALMLASVLNSEIAIQASLFVVRAFVHLRRLLAPHKQLAAKLAEIEQRVGRHDEAILDLVAAIRKLMEKPAPRRRAIGFRNL